MVLRALPPSRISLRLSLQLLLLMGVLVTMGGIEALWKRSAKVKVTGEGNDPSLNFFDPALGMKGDMGQARTVATPCPTKPFDNSSQSELRGQIALVTGVAGFIGSHVAQHCLRSGMKVIGLDDLSSGYANNIPREVRFVHGNVGDPKLLDKLFSRYRFDQVYHLAGHGSVRLSHHLRSFTYVNEIVSSAHLLNAVIRAGETKCFVYLSSSAVYGETENNAAQPRLFTESDTAKPISPYGTAKLAVEHDLLSAHKKFGQNFIAFRAHNVYGPGMNIRDPYHGVVGAYLMAHLTKDKRQLLTVFGDGSQKRSFTYVSDLAEIISLAPTITSAHNQVFNVGSDEVLSVGELVEAVKDAMGKEMPTLQANVPLEQSHLTVDHTKFRCIFGERRWMSLKQGLQETIPWIMQMFSGLSQGEVADVLRHRCIAQVELKNDADFLDKICKNMKEILAVERISSLHNAEHDIKRWPGRVERV